MAGIIISKAMLGTTPVQKMYIGKKEVYRLTPLKVGPYVLLEDGNYLPLESFKGYGSSVEKGRVYANVPDYVTSRAATICITESALNYYESIEFTFEKKYSSVYGDSYDVSYTVTNKDGTKNINGGLYIFKKEVDGVLLTHSEGDEFSKTNFNHENMTSLYGGSEVPNKKLILSASPLKGKDPDKAINLALFYKTETAEGGFLLSMKKTDSLSFCSLNEEVPGCALELYYSDAVLDMNGSKNTQAFLDKYSEEEAPIPYACNNYIFPTGQRGYVPSLGQLHQISLHYDDIVSFAEKTWDTFYGDVAVSSTQYDDRSLHTMQLSTSNHSTTSKQTTRKSCIVADIIE